MVQEISSAIRAADFNRDVTRRRGYIVVKINNIRQYLIMLAQIGTVLMLQITVLLHTCGELNQK